MSNFRYIVLLLVVTLTIGIGTVTAQTDDSDQAARSTISVGLSLDKAISVLEQNGCNKPYGLAWAKPAADRSVGAFQIDDGIVLALTYADSAKSLTAIQMIFTPPTLAKANNRIVGLRRISFEPDGTYILHVLKQGKGSTESVATPNPQLPKFPPSK